MTKTPFETKRHIAPLSFFAAAALLPEHLQAPTGMSQHVHEINLALTAIMIEAQTTYNWLNRKQPDMEAANKTAARLHQHAGRLDQLVNSL